MRTCCTPVVCGMSSAPEAKLGFYDPVNPKFKGGRNGDPK